MVELFVYNSIGVNEFVSGEGWEDYDYEKVDVNSEVIKEYYVYDDIIKIVVEDDYNEMVVLDEIDRIDEEVFGF
jgi:hypothetical protein